METASRRDYAAFPIARDLSPPSSGLVRAERARTRTHARMDIYTRAFAGGRGKGATEALIYLAPYNWPARVKQDLMAL